jgi:hypothetical protein
MDSKPFTLIQDNHNYLIAWQILSKDSEIGIRFDVRSDISLPHFLDKKESEKIRNGEEVEVNEHNLLIGLLLEYFTPPPLTVTHKMKPYFKDVLVWLLKETIKENEVNSNEEYILAIAAQLKSRVSPFLAYKVLKTGLEIFPYNPKILKQMWKLAEAMSKNG